MFEGFSEMQNVVSRIHTRVDSDQESEYYRLEFGCERFKHISGTEAEGDRKVVKEEPLHRFKWWKH
ncbi:hypothetical protein [Paenibacillus dakarensis]|uniref:hypothetical protein n=1 Tax=Paenibacillus dakarensis TaxID=1527293 RepID=UPI0006D57C06|nr:hypothetical protein [Paenibacillus dakarensis]